MKVGLLGGQTGRGQRHQIIRRTSFENSKLFKPRLLSLTLGAVSGMSMGFRGRDGVSSP